MPVESSLVAIQPQVFVAAISPLATLVLVAGLRFLSKRFDARLDQNKDVILTELVEMKGEIKAIGTQVTDHDGMLHVHGERLAWLEGQAGQPLGSTPLVRKNE